jgi:hypothetical protein
MKRTPLLRPSYFVWALVLAGLFAAHALVGLPHGLFSYSFDVVGGGDPWNLADRWYTRCTFIGPYGPFTTHPADGQCPWVVLRRGGESGGAQ